MPAEHDMPTINLTKKDASLRRNLIHNWRKEFLFSNVEENSLLVQPQS